jgi:hypothetical protein
VTLILFSAIGLSLKTTGIASTTNNAASKPKTINSMELFTENFIAEIR